MGFNRDRNGWYGNDDKTNRFTDPKTGEAYFTLVNEKTGEIELWNEDFGFADKKVGTLNPETGKMDYNGKWFSNDTPTFDIKNENFSIFSIIPHYRYSRR